MNNMEYEYSNSRPIPELEDYRVTSTGIVFSKSGVPLVQHESTKGYLYVRVYYNGGKHKYFVHRAVGKAFIPNPENLYCINHKDENKKNNNVDNLEWCTLAYNLGYGSKPSKTAAANQRIKGHKVLFNDGEKAILYPSINEASKQTNVCRSIITRLCKSGKSKQWRYA